MRPGGRLQEAGDARPEGSGKHGEHDREEDVDGAGERDPGRADETAAVWPARYCPCPPMLNIPQRNAKASASPVSISGVATISVCWRFEAALPRFPTPGMSQLRPVPLKIAL